MAIYKLDGERGFVISSGGRWLPGVYETERAARYAFRFPDEVLYRLNDRICRVDGEYRLITSADLTEAKRD